jgi:hypothetical protein
MQKKVTGRLKIYTINLLKIPGVLLSKAEAEIKPVDLIRVMPAQGRFISISFPAAFLFS